MKIKSYIFLVIVFISTIVINAQQSAYKVQNIPGKVYMKNYDLGGEGVAYHEAGTNHCGIHRGTDLLGMDPADGDTVLSCICKGEWHEYTLTSVTDGTYDIDIRYATTILDPSIKIRLIKSAGDTINLVSTALTKTASWTSYTTLRISNVSLTSGSLNILRIEYMAGYEWVANVNWVDFIPYTSLFSVNETKTKICYNSIIGKFEVKGFSNINKIEVYNIIGTSVYTKDNLGSTFASFGNELPKGIYIVKVYSQEGIYSTKVVKY